MGQYYSVSLGRAQHSVRCMCVVGEDRVWCAYRNQVHVINAALFIHFLLNTIDFYR